MKNQKGITLVALIITIIVMLILAGVSISLVVGEDGVLTQAQSAGEKTRVGEIRQAIELGFSDLTMQYYQETDATSTKNYNEAQEVFLINNVIDTIAANSNGAFEASAVSVVGAMDYKYKDSTLPTGDQITVEGYDSTKVGTNYAKWVAANTTVPSGAKMITNENETGTENSLFVYGKDALVDVKDNSGTITTAKALASTTVNTTYTVTDGEYMLGQGTLFINVEIQGVDYLFAANVNKGANTYTLGSVAEIDLTK